MFLWGAPTLLPLWQPLCPWSLLWYSLDPLVAGRIEHGCARRVPCSRSRKRAFAIRRTCLPKHTSGTLFGTGHATVVGRSCESPRGLSFRPRPKPSAPCLFDQDRRPRGEICLRARGTSGSQPRPTASFLVTPCEVEGSGREGEACSGRRQMSRFRCAPLDMTRRVLRRA